VPDENTIPLLTRLWFAWICFFNVLFDGSFAARVWGVRQAVALPLPPPQAPTGQHELLGLPRGKVATPTPPKNDGTSALQLLSLLQRDGRLVDFLQQDIASFSDADVGVAARVVHEGCRKALGAHADIAPVRTEDEGTRIEVAAGFDPDSVKLVGELRGDPPYRGVLRHRGWKAKKLDLPRVVGDYDASILAPAEVELG
jgi:hypothetical protein